MLELEELFPEPDVDARGLNLEFGIVEGLDDEVAGLHAIEEIGVGEDHTHAEAPGRVKRTSLGARVATPMPARSLPPV
ncbi:hypothetical protein GCM10009066_04790 [Halarchaeum salinum]|uniref:Uncharacterized protein n=1 Tax=Halarchaeum salinum TaxID=489912 RepID=A0AAV3S425_9EURY